MPTTLTLNITVKVDVDDPDKVLFAGANGTDSCEPTTVQSNLVDEVRMGIIESCWRANGTGVLAFVEQVARV